MKIDRDTLLDPVQSRQLESEMLENGRLQISALQKWVDEFKNNPSPVFQKKAAQLDDAVKCLSIGMYYMEEMNKAWRGEAFYCASTFGAASLEAFLLSRCYTSQDEIKTLKKWQLLKRAQKEDFQLFARSMDLGKLLEIAQELQWFPSNGIPARFVEIALMLLGEENTAELTNVLTGAPNIGELCALHLKGYRNRLHAAVCLKEDFLPSKEGSLAAAILFLVAMFSLSDRAKSVTT